MDISSSFVQVSIVTLLIIFSLSLSRLIKRNPIINLPPGRTGFPIIGETLQYLSKGRKSHLEKFFSERMSKFSPKVFKTSLFGSPMIVFCGVQGNKFLFSNENKLVTVWFPRSVSKIFPSSEQTSSNEEMIKMKKILPQFLKPEALHCYIGIMDSTAQKHLDSNWEKKNEVKVFPLAKMFTFQIASRLFISLEDPKHVAKFFEHFESLTSGLFSIPIDFPGTAFNRGVKASNLTRKVLQGIIKQRRVDIGENRAPPQDILSHMLLTPTEDGKYMDETNIADKILGLLVGGHDTTTIVITSFVKYLAELPEVYNEVLKEQIEIAKSKVPGELLNWNDIQKMTYSWNVVCEVLRLAPPVQGTFREAIVDFSYAGFSIPKRSKLHWSPHSTHRSSEFFPDPEKFDPSRFKGIGPMPYTYVPFGGGPRICPGREYARLEILVFMHNLVKRFKWEMVITNEKIILNPLLAPEKGLPIRLFHHNF